MLRIICLVFLLFFTISPCSAGDDKDPNPFNLPDSVMAMPKYLWPGNPFQGYKELQPKVTWHSIPSRLAGDWVSNEQRILRQDDFTTGAYYTIPTTEAATVVEHLGDLQDADGTIWHALISPEIHAFQKKKFIDCQQVLLTKMWEKSPNHILIWSRKFHVVYNPMGNQIVTSYTEEKVSQFEVTTTARIIGRTYLRLYDANGDVQLSAQTLRTFVRQKAFQNRSERAGVGLYDSLASHLQYIGRHDLIAW